MRRTPPPAAANRLRQVLAALTLATLTGCQHLPGQLGGSPAQPDSPPEPVVVDLSDWRSGQANPNAPEAVFQFGQFVGIWEARQSSLQQDGVTWQTSDQPALWRWYWILDGWAVQDDWIAPAPGLEPGPEGRGFGTNIRVYNQARDEWQAAWISNRGQEVWEFTARWHPDTGELVMESVDLTPPRRNTFHAITGDSFEWTQEWTFDNGRTWVPVARISAIRRQ